VTRRNKRRRDRQSQPRRPLTTTRQRVLTVWLFARTGLQLIGLLAESHEGLYLTAQTLVVAGDLAVNAIVKRNRR
jgi:hypothetical protein